MQDSSSIGVHVVLKASNTYPNGIIFSAFPEDGDVGDTGQTEIAGNASGINGDLITWTTVNGIELNLPIIPNTTEEAALDRLYQANRGSKNHFPAKDVITIVITNPITGVVSTYKNGRIKTGPVGYQYGGDGRIKTKSYGFVFEDKV